MKKLKEILQKYPIWGIVESLPAIYFGFVNNQNK